MVYVQPFLFSEREPTHQNTDVDLAFLGNSDLGLGLRPVSNFNYCYETKNCSHNADEIHLCKSEAAGRLKAYTDIGFVLTSAQHKPLAGPSPQE